jgi:hypothetical protein
VGKSLRRGLYGGHARRSRHLLLLSAGVQRVSIVDVKVPKDLKVGYIMGAGDDIPTVLEQIGMNVTMIPAEKLASGRPEQVSDDRAGHSRLRHAERCDRQQQAAARFRREGRATGRAIQHAGIVWFADRFQFGQVHAVSGNAQPGAGFGGRGAGTILDPANPIFHSPNEITQKDFEGWVQERGLYFMSQWDANFTPLLESHDPGEASKRAGCW